MILQKSFYYADLVQLYLKIYWNLKELFDFVIFHNITVFYFIFLIK